MLSQLLYVAVPHVGLDLQSVEIRQMRLQAAGCAGTGEGRREGRTTVLVRGGCVGTGGRIEGRTDVLFRGVPKQMDGWD